jgi:hypothetical protein
VLAFPSFAKAQSSAADVKCILKQSPQINIRPYAAPVQYVNNYSAIALSELKTSTINPYQAGLPILKFGITNSARLIELEVLIGGESYSAFNVSCLWYQTINVDLKLFPIIYLANDISGQKCNREVKKHELKHAQVAKLVISKYAHLIGNDLKGAVQGAGAMGPYNNGEVEGMQEMMMNHIKSVISSRELQMHTELKTLNGQVDSEQEYNRISKICYEEKLQNK